MAAEGLKTQIPTSVLAASNLAADPAMPIVRGRERVNTLDAFKEDKLEENFNSLKNLKAKGPNRKSTALRQSESSKRKIYYPCIRL